MSIFGRKNNVITYTVNKDIGKDIYITVQNGEVVVNAPWYFTPSRIQQLVQNKRNWILSKIQEYNEVLSNIQTVKIFGKNYDIYVKYANTKAPELNLKENYEIEIILPNKYRKIENEQILKMSIEKMYVQIANNELENIMEKIRKIFGIAPEEYQIQKMDGILGKCNNKKIIINPEIMRYKKETIEYIIAHEFCHLKYKSHCKSFYKMIEKIFPKYLKIEDEIKEYDF